MARQCQQRCLGLFLWHPAVSPAPGWLAAQRSGGSPSRACVLVNVLMVFEIHSGSLAGAVVVTYSWCGLFLGQCPCVAVAPALTGVGRFHCMLLFGAAAWVHFCRNDRNDVDFVDFSCGIWWCGSVTASMSCTFSSIGDAFPGVVPFWICQFLVRATPMLLRMPGGLCWVLL